MSETLKIIVLSLANWLHLFATVAWVGTVNYNLLILMPAGRKALEPPLMGKLMNAVTKRFRIMIYVSIAVIVITGIVIQFMGDKYAGLTLKDFLMQVTLLKHLIILIVVIFGIYVLEGLVPKASKLGEKGPTPEFGAIQKKIMSIGVTNYILLIIVLLLTGIATAL